MSYGLDMMNFTVGWHYMKQSFGVFVVLSALRNAYYNVWQRGILLCNSYVVWFFSYVYPKPAVISAVKPSFANGSIIYANLHVFPYWLVQISLVMMIVSCFAVITVIVHAWVAENKRPPVSALTGYFSMYYLFAFVGWLHPAWILMAPFFHSLQYIMFVIALRRGQSRKELADYGDDLMDTKSMLQIRGRHQRFFAYAFLLGLLFFLLIPGGMDLTLHHFNNNWKLGFFVFFFSMFINIQHYFIDNVIWRKENRTVGEYLFKWSR